MIWLAFSFNQKHTLLQSSQERFNYFLSHRLQPGKSIQKATKELTGASADQFSQKQKLRVALLWVLA